MANDVQLFKAAGLSLANIGKYKAALAKVQASAPVIGGVPILRLDKEGVWRYGQQLTEIEPGSLWAANPLTFCKGWTAWKQGVNKPLGSQMRNILSGELVDPNSLPDNGGKWTESVEVEFRCINGEDEGKQVKYTSNSMGGVERWHELVAQLSHQFEVDPNKLVAVVELTHDGYFHTDQSFGVRHPETKKPGWVVKPIFKVVDWMAMDGTGGGEQPDDEQDEGDQQEEPQPEQVAPTGRRQSSINAGANGAAATPPPTRRQSSIKPTGAQLDAQATKLTGQPAEPGPDPVVRRRRRAS